MKALTDFRRRKTFPSATLESISNEHELSAQESSLTKIIAYGVLQNMALCDFYISHYSTVDLKKIQPQVLDILRLSVYQIALMSKIPFSAAVDEGVKLATKKANPRAAKYVNAVLRKISQDAMNDCLPHINCETDFELLSIKYSHPEWLVRELASKLNLDEVEEVLRFNNNHRIPVIAQVNVLTTDTDTVIESLIAECVQAKKHKWLGDCIELTESGRIDHLTVFQRGYIYIQDVAARLVVIAANPKPGDYVIDGCAAPGGKSFAAAIMMRNDGYVLSCDVREEKIRQIDLNAERMGLQIVDTRLCDSSVLDTQIIEKADIVIADVPCSGFGVIRKKPDIRYKQNVDIEELRNIQKNILFNLSRYVKPGGTLVYSTCTMIDRENCDVINEFLSENNDFSLLAFDLPNIGEVSTGMITLWPHIYDIDGFFICKLKRSA